jgi:hypothetical protein
LAAKAGQPKDKNRLALIARGAATYDMVIILSKPCFSSGPPEKGPTVVGSERHGHASARPVMFHQLRIGVARSGQVPRPSLRTWQESP